MNILISKIFSPRKIADSRLPKIGTKKLNTDMIPTLLYFNSCVHTAKATEERTAIYKSRLIDLNVKPVKFPPNIYPNAKRTNPPINN